MNIFNHNHNPSQTRRHVGLSQQGWLLSRLSLALLALAAGLFSLASVIIAADTQSTPTLYSVDSGDFFFPPYPSEANRFGISVGGGITIERFDVALLNAGWYLDWGSRLEPPHPGQLEYAQLIGLSVNTGPCGKYKPPASSITQVSHITGSALINSLAANPGALWMIGNEPDSIYNCMPVMPDTYAQVYHNLYTFIKQHDPSARVAIGGIIQPTPIRLEYLDKVWDAYYRFYSTTLPTDLWNIHLYALREVAGEWGASVPPGATSNGIDYPRRASVDMSIMSGHIERMRAWMAAKGEQNKPLIITEYGVLWPPDYCDGSVCFDEPAVARYMTQTFDYFLTAVNPTIGYPADGYRLVQMWNWFSANDNDIFNGDLFYLDGRLSIIGQAYINYAAPLVTPYHDQALWSFTASPPDSSQPTVTLYATLAEMGNTPSTSATVEFYDGPPGALRPPFASYPVQQTLARYSSTANAQASWVAPATGVYTFYASLSPGVADANFANNTRTATLDLRPDLATQLSVASELVGHTAATLSAQATLSNYANNSTSYLYNALPDLPAAMHASVPSYTIIATAHVTVTNVDCWPVYGIATRLVATSTQTNRAIYTASQVFDAQPGQPVPLTFTWTMTQPGVYIVTATTDPDQTLVESTRSNNTATQILDIRPDLALSKLSNLPGVPFLVGKPSVLVTISALLSNIGGYVSSGPISVTLRVSDSNTHLVHANEVAVPGLWPRQSAPITFTWDATATGAYMLTLIADSGDLGAEIDPANNIVSQLVLIASHRIYLPLALSNAPSPMADR